MTSKFTFKRTYKPETYELSPVEEVIMESEEVTVDGLANVFKRFLLASGFILGDGDFFLVEEGEVVVSKEDLEQGVEVSDEEYGDLCNKRDLFEIMAKAIRTSEKVLRNDEKYFASDLRFDLIGIINKIDEIEEGSYE